MLVCNKPLQGFGVSCQLRGKCEGEMERWGEGEKG